VYRLANLLRLQTRRIWSSQVTGRIYVIHQNGVGKYPVVDGKRLMEKSHELLLMLGNRTGNGHLVTALACFYGKVPLARELGSILPHDSSLVFPYDGKSATVWEPVSRTSDRGEKNLYLVLDGPIGVPEAAYVAYVGPNSRPGLTACDHDCAGRN